MSGVRLSEIRRVSAESEPPRLPRELRQGRRPRELRKYGARTCRTAPSAPPLAIVRSSSHTAPYAPFACAFLYAVCFMGRSTDHT